MFKHRFSKLALATLLLSTAPVAIATQAQTVNDNNVLVTAGGVQFTQDMANVWITLGEFLAERQFTPEEKAWISQAEAGHFAQDPQRGITGLKNLQPTFAKIKALESDPIQLARYREDLFDEIHLNRAKAEKTDTQDYLTIVYNYSPVIYTDIEANLVVTAKDIISLYAANNLMSQMVFKTDYDSRNSIESIQQDFSQLYPQADLETKRFYAKAEGRWKALVAGWPTLGPNGQQQILSKIAQDAREPKNIPVYARWIENSFYYTDEERAAMAQNLAKSTPEPEQETANEILDEVTRRNSALIESSGDFYDLLTLQQEFYY